MPAARGTRPPAAGRGRPSGSKNRLGQEARHALKLTFEGIGGVPALIEWASTHREAFYKLYAKLIPVQLDGTGKDGRIEIVISPRDAAL